MDSPDSKLARQPRTTVDHADVVGDLLHLMYAVLVCQNRLELVLRGNDDAISSWNQTKKGDVSVR